MTTHSNTLDCKIPWTEESGGLQSTGSDITEHTHTSTSDINGDKTVTPKSL